MENTVVTEYLQSDKSEGHPEDANELGNELSLTGWKSDHEAKSINIPRMT